MTTYLATIHPGTEDEVTRAYCSPGCRWVDWRWFDVGVLHNDAHYEFDETCAYCGVLIDVTRNHLTQARAYSIERITELKASHEVEISEHILRADSLRAELRRMEEELELDGRDAVSEAVERIVEALEAAVYESDNQYDRLVKDGLGGSEREAGRGGGVRLAIALLRSRDWSKGEGE